MLWTTVLLIRRSFASTSGGLLHRSEPRREPQPQLWQQHPLLLQHWPVVSQLSLIEEAEGRLAEGAVEHCLDAVAEALVAAMNAPSWISFDEGD